MWIKKSDQTPEPGQLIVMWYVDPGLNNKHGGWVGTADQSGIWNYATHWMPLHRPKELNPLVQLTK